MRLDATQDTERADLHPNPRRVEQLGERTVVGQNDPNPVAQLYDRPRIGEEHTTRAVKIIGSVQKQHRPRLQPATSVTTDRHDDAKAAGLRDVAATRLAADARW
jgi:hypothetical protein